MNEGKTVVAGRREVKKSGIRRKAPKLLSENGEPRTDNRFLFSLQLLYLEDGGPLTGNGVFHQRPAGSPLFSVQRLLRSQSPLVASLCFAKASLALGVTDQAKPDWTVSADWRVLAFECLD